MFILVIWLRVKVKLNKTQQNKTEFKQSNTHHMYSLLYPVLSWFECVVLFSGQCYSCFRALCLTSSGLKRPCVKACLDITFFFQEILMVNNFAECVCWCWPFVTALPLKVLYNEAIHKQCRESAATPCWWSASIMHYGSIHNAWLFQLQHLPVLSWLIMIGHI